MHAKFEVSSSNHSRDMEVSQNFKKIGHMTPYRPPLTEFLIIIVSAPGGQSARQI